MYLIDIVQAPIMGMNACIRGMKNGRIYNFSNVRSPAGGFICVVGQFYQWSIYPTGEKDFPSPPETCQEGLIFDIVGDAIFLRGPAATYS